MIIKNRDGNNLSAIEQRPEDANGIVVMCHGFTSRKERLPYAMLAESLEKRGIASLRYDAFGHGESYGDIKNLTVSQATNDLLDVLNYAGNDFAKIGIMGTSFGGFVATLASARSDSVNALVLKAPAVNWQDRWERKFGKKGILKWEKTGFTEHKNKQGTPNRMSYGLYEDLLKLKPYDEAEHVNCPTLIVQGTEDIHVLQEDNEKLQKAIPNCELKLLKELIISLRALTLN